MAEGIITRHSRSCTTRRGVGKCSCTPTYQPRVWHPREKRYINGPTATSKAEAKSWRVDAMGQLKKGLLRTTTKETLQDAAETFWAGICSGAILDRKLKPYKPSTARSYEANLRKRVLPAFGRMKLAEITRNDLQDFADGLLASGLSPASVLNVLMPLRPIYSRAIYRGG